MVMTPEQQLKTATELAQVNSKLESVVEGVEKIEKQMDRVFDMQLQITRMQQEQIDARESLKRAYERIEANENDSQNVKEQTSKWINRGIGAWMVGSIMFVAIQALILDRVKGYESTQAAQTDTLVTVDRRLAWIEYELKRNAREGK
jgi:hypothetical protein